MIIGMWEYWGDGHDLAGTDTVSGIFFGILGRRLVGFSEGTVVLWTGSNGNLVSLITFCPAVHYLLGAAAL